MLSLHPENPRYPRFRGRPTVLVTSGEHYGAVINLDFDYVRYLDALGAAGLNLTRVFVGSYVEGEKSLHFAGSERNTLAPRPGRLVAPWARSDVPGYVNGGNKFDLDRWDESCFARMRDFTAAAAARGVVVEVTLFSNPYSEYSWGHSPLHAANHVNAAGRACRYSDVTTLKDAALVARQEQLVRKVAGELGAAENVYFEICNEPEDHRPEVRQWLEHIDRVVHLADGGVHLIASNAMRHRTPPANASVLNFHYTWGRDLIGAIEAATDDQSGLVLSFDESIGPLLHQTPAQVRVEAWEFLIGGGAIYNGLSWEYSADHPAGQGRGHHAVLKQLGVLKRFMDSLDLLRMKPAPSIIVTASGNARVRVLANAPEDYVIYVHHGRRDERGADVTYTIDARPRRVELVLDLPRGRFKAYWIDPASTTVVGVEPFAHDAGHRRFLSPAHEEDLLLRIRRQR